MSRFRFQHETSQPDPTMSTPQADTALIRHLGHADYDSTFAAMRAFTDARTPDTRDELWIVEHPPVFTLGRESRPGTLSPTAQDA